MRNRVLWSVIAFLLLQCLCGCTKQDEEVIVYPLFCDGSIRQGKCRGRAELYLLDRIVFSVSKQKQEILYWRPGIDSSPSRLKNCVVKDRENWKGQYPDGSARLVMKQGKFKAVPRKGKRFEKHILYVGKWHYWFFDWTGYSSLRVPKKRKIGVVRQ
jgi:hypothetical protein